MPLFKDIVAGSCIFTDTDENEYTFDEVQAVQITRGGKELSSADADDFQHSTLEDSSDHTVDVTLYLKNLVEAVGGGLLGMEQGTACPPIGAAGSLAFTVKTAEIGGSDLPVAVGDGTNTYVRRMNGAGHPLHADVNCAGMLHFSGFCPVGDTDPLSV